MKTDDHNKQLYRDMQEEPDKYSDMEIEAMMDDLDQVPDVDEAWQQFTQRSTPNFNDNPNDNPNSKLLTPHSKLLTPNSKRPIHTWHKIAAMLIGILTLSGIAFAAVHIARQAQHEERPVTAAEKPRSAITLSRTHTADTIARAEPVVFDNVPLDSIVKDIASYHHLDIDLQNERLRVGASAGMQASGLRFYFVWNRDDSLKEVIEKLNMFEQVNLSVENGKLIVR